MPNQSGKFRNPHKAKRPNCPRTEKGKFKRRASGGAKELTDQVHSIGQELKTVQSEYESAEKAFLNARFRLTSLQWKRTRIRQANLYGNPGPSARSNPLADLIENFQLTVQQAVGEYGRTQDPKVLWGALPGVQFLSESGHPVGLSECVPLFMPGEFVQYFDRVSKVIERLRDRAVNGFKISNSEILEALEFIPKGKRKPRNTFLGLHQKALDDAVAVNVAFQLVRGVPHMEAYKRVSKIQNLRRSPNRIRAVWQSKLKTNKQDRD